MNFIPGRVIFSCAGLQQKAPERNITMEKNTRRVGTVSRGIRCPNIRKGDDLASIVTESVLLAAKEEGF